MSVNLSHLDTSDIDQLITTDLQIRNDQKKYFGEVFTPAPFIHEMLDHFPPTVWKNPHLTWLEPACGIGGFMLHVYHRLFHGLQTVIPNDSARHRHIIQNMLYMVELNPDNVTVLQERFGKKANIYKGDFLGSSWQTVFKHHKYDVILGNPPFNNIRDKELGTSAGKMSILWKQFLRKSLTLSAENGYIAYIHPCNWRAPCSLWNKMKQKELLYLHIYSKASGRKLFGIHTRFDLYVMQNKPHATNTLVIDELHHTHHMDLTKWDFFPNYAYSLILPIVTTPDKGIHVVFNGNLYASSNCKKERSEKFKYPVVHTITKEGVGVLYTDQQKGHFGIPKVILNLNEKQYSHNAIQNDYQGKYGMSQLSFGLPIQSKRQGELILRAIQTPEFQTILAACKWTYFQTSQKLFTYFVPTFYTHFLQSMKTKRNRRQTHYTQKRNKKIS